MPKVEDTHETANYLKWLSFLERKSPRKGWKYINLAHFTFKNATVWKKQLFPDAYRNYGRLGMISDCYNNAYFLIAEHPKQLRYVEGVATHKMLGWDKVVFHAWAVDANDKVVDPTWIDQGMDYFGVEFDHAYLLKHFLRSGSLIDNGKDVYPLITGKHPKTMWQPKTCKPSPSCFRGGRVYTYW